MSKKATYHPIRWFGGPNGGLTSGVLSDKKLRKLQGSYAWVKDRCGKWFCYRIKRDKVGAAYVFICEVEQCFDEPPPEKATGP